ncbi:MAG: hypothetical protein WBE92_12490 [Steroidobacteraceae bacterium]
MLNIVNVTEGASGGPLAAEPAQATVAPAGGLSLTYGMLKRFQFWVLSAIGALCVAVVITNMVLFSGNQGLQGRVNEQVQYLQQSAQLQGLYQQMVQALANLSVQNHDEQLSAVLAKQGIKVNANPAPAAGSAAGAQAPSSSDTSGQESSGSRGRRSGHHD